MEVVVITEDRAREIVMLGSEAARDGTAAYLSAVQSLLSGIVGCDLIMWNDIDMLAGTVTIEGENRDEWAWLLPTVATLAPENPMAHWFLSSESMPLPVRMSDLTERTAFRRSALYNELFRAMGARFQAGLPTARHRNRYARGWALNRRRSDFTSREMDLLNRVQPALSLLEDLIGQENGRSSATANIVEAAELDRLTRREREVLDYLASGWTAGHIARALRISPATVRKHLEHIYAKLGTHDRLLAAEVAGRAATPAPQQDES